mgnify:CR=1 FL=1
MVFACSVTPGPTRPPGILYIRKNTQNQSFSPRCHLKLLLCFKKNFLITLSLTHGFLGRGSNKRHLRTGNTNLEIVAGHSSEVTLVARVFYVLVMDFLVSFEFWRGGSCIVALITLEPNAFVDILPVCSMLRTYGDIFKGRIAGQILRYWVDRILLHICTASA